MKPDHHIIVFAKKPELGRVKTRLAADIGDQAALEFYDQTLMGLLARLAPVGDWRCWISLSPDDAVRQPAFWPDPFTAIPQGTGDLGARMAHAFDALPPGPAVLVGADIPAIEPHHIKSAFQALDDHDTVFGPASDGGYWLVGSNRAFAAAEMFKNVRWSTEHALADTLANVTALNKSAAQVATLQDIDDGEALRRWLTNVPSGGA